MTLESYADLSSLVSPERVHKACYADERVFEEELEKIFYKFFKINDVQFIR